MVIQPEQFRSDGGGGAVRVDPDEPQEAPAQLALNPSPTDDSTLLPGGDYTILVALTARDTDATFYRIDMTFDGLWWDAATIRDHLKVSQPARTRETAF